MRGHTDPALRAGKLQRDGADLRVGFSPESGADGLRAAAAPRGALAARGRRVDRVEPRRLAWALVRRAGPGDSSRARASAPTTQDSSSKSYARRPELTLALAAPAELRELAERQATIVRHVDAARDLANRPPNDLTPPALAAHAKSLAGGPLTVESYGRDWIEEQGMGAFAAVARSSAEDPQLIVMRYDPPAAAADVTVGLVGKAITFDSGGISLKPPLRMQDMKGDMAGGAAVIEATAAIAELGLPVRILTVVASTENLQGRQRVQARRHPPRRRTARRSRSSTPTPRGGSSSPTRSTTRAPTAPRT